MKFFSVPADFNIKTIDHYAELNNDCYNSKIIETYGQVTIGRLLNSGRVIKDLPQVSSDDLKKYIKYSQSKGIEFNYTLNPACLGNKEFTKQGMIEIKDLLYKLEEIGVDSVTVAMPSIIELIQKAGFHFKLKASAICEITSPQKAAFYKSMGMDRIVLDPDITRNFNAIKNIYESFGEGIEIIVNNMCFKDCAYKMFHYSHEAHHDSEDKDIIQDYYVHKCTMQKAKDKANYIKLNWIRPEDLYYYEKCGIKNYKIQGRNNLKQGDIVRTVKHYFEEKYSGNLLDLITIFAPYNSFQPYLDNIKLNGFLRRFYEYPEICNGLCEKCKYCETYINKCTNIKLLLDINEKAKEFCSLFDKYSKNASDQIHIKNNDKNVSIYSKDLDFNL